MRCLLIPLSDDACLPVFSAFFRSHLKSSFFFPSMKDLLVASFLSTISDLPFLNFFDHTLKGKNPSLPRALAPPSASFFVPYPPPPPRCVYPVSRKTFPRGLLEVPFERYILCSSMHDPDISKSTIEYSPPFKIFLRQFSGYTNEPFSRFPAFGSFTTPPECVLFCLAIGFGEHLIQVLSLLHEVLRLYETFPISTSISAHQTFFPPPPL